jgi:hypothetical protein
MSLGTLALNASTEVQLAGRTVGVSLVKADDFSPIAWPGAGFKLDTYKVTPQAATSIYDLLTTAGIVPDADAYALVYDLNPSLQQIDPLPAGLSLELPRVTGGDDLQNKLRNGYLAMLVIDGNLREELARSANALQVLSRRFAGITTERFPSASTRQAMMTHIEALSGWFAHIQRTHLQRTGPPLRRQTLEGILDEAQALTSILTAILDTQGKVTPSDIEQVSVIYRDMQLQMKKYDNVMAGEPPAADSQYKVVVTIRGGDSGTAALQVYYAWEGLFRKPPREPLQSHSFDGVGSGSSAVLTIADYVIWAGRPGHPFPPLTDQKPIAIGPVGGNPRQVELSIER